MKTGNGQISDPADKTVLIVEDDEAIMDFMCFLVEAEGFVVEKAFDGEQGLWKAENLAPDIILLDLMLPKCGGFDILKELQAGDKIAIPVVIITGAASEFSKEAALRKEPNVRGFMRKPVSVPALTALLHQILNTKKA
ncbi:MAG: response regulator [Elusimicrobiota bacterium]|nr:response regulator [Elusimicrobiota bacterium]